MGRFGKKVEVSLDPLSYNICVLGESKIGKTTICKEICEKLAGESGYIHFDIGREEGRLAIQNLISEPIEDWAKLKEVVEDIVENKEADYPDLKVVIWDTLDELILIAENESIREYNKKNPDKRTDTISGAWGGFWHGQEYAMELILDKMWELKKVGVSSMIISHVRRTDITDPVSQETFSKLTADTQQKYFNMIKNKMHFIGLAYIDRDIVKEKIGRKNVVTKQDITTNKVVSESRVISFRDDTYSVDSGSRFAEIVDHIPFDSDAFIKAMQDAILAEQKKGNKSLAESKKDQKKRDETKAKEAAEYSKAAKENKADPDRNEELKSIIQEKLPELDKDKKMAFKQKMAELEITNFKDVSEMPTKKLEALVEFLN